METTLWATAACVIGLTTHVGAFALAVDPEFPNSKLNEEHIYTVDVALYTVEAVMLMVSAFFKLLMVGANI